MTNPPPDPPPDRDKYEQKPDQADGFNRTYKKSSREHPKARVGAANREYVVRTPMEEEVKLTGQWRHKEHRYHLFINQAGPHIQMLLALVENGPSGKDKDVPRDKVRIQTRLVRLGGDIELADRELYHLYLNYPDDPVTGDRQCGTLRYSNAGKRIKLEFDLSGIDSRIPIVAKLASLKSTVAVRFGQGPNLFDNHISRPWIAPEVRSRLWFPLTLKQIARLPSGIFNGRLDARSDNYTYKQDGGPRELFGYVDLLIAYNMTLHSDLPAGTKRSYLRNAAAALEQLVFECWNVSLQHSPEDGGIDDFHKDHWRMAALESLRANMLTVSGQTQPRSLLTHTLAVLNASHGISYPNFAEYLHLQPTTNGHYYAAELEVTDAGGSADKLEKILRKYYKKAAKKLAKQLKRRLPAGGLLGMLIVKKQDDPAQNPDADKQQPEWVCHYIIALAGLKLSPSQGSSAQLISSTGEAKHVYGRPWEPEQLVGVVTFTDVGASIFGGGGGKAASMTVLSCFGTGSGKPPTPLQLNFSGISDIYAFKPGVDAAFSSFVGAVIYPTSVHHEPEIEAPPEDLPFLYGSQSAAGPLHFPINQAALSREGEFLLQAFAATELAVLCQKGVSMRIDGYADQPDKAFRNMILSRNRAISAFNYLKNIMGKDLAVPDLKMPPDEEREQDEADIAKAKGEKFEIFIPHNDHVTIHAHGEPKETEEENKKAKPEYNQEFRRVDISIDGGVRVGLRRKNDGSTK
jgi:hypothetical protein